MGSSSAFRSIWVSVALSLGAGPGAIAASANPPTRVVSFPADQVGAAIAEASGRFGLPQAWIRAVIRVESGGDPHAVSGAGAMGLMQLVPATYAKMRAALGLGPDPFAVRDNILAGAAYLRQMFDRYGSPGFLAAYNAGPGRWEDQLTGVRALPAETIHYLARLGPMIGAGVAGSSGINPPLRRGSPFRSPLFVQISTAPGKDTALNEAPTTGPIAASAPPGTLLFVPRSPSGAPK